MTRLEGRVAVITGASSGIGRATARLFAAEGACVVLADVLEEPGQALARELGERAVFARADVSREEDVAAALERAVGRFGRLDCVFNNAGIPGAGGPIDLIPQLGFDITIAILFRGVFFGMKHAARLMKPQGSGSIVSTSSIAGHRTGFGGHLYSACKAAVIQLTRTVALELGPFGIRTNAICPGGIVTSIFGRGVGLDQAASESTYPALSEVFRDLQAVPRAGLPEDIARTALWLASDESSFVNGAAIHVDGGIPDGLFDSAERAARLAAALGVELPES